MKLPFKSVTICPLLTAVKNSALKLHVVVMQVIKFYFGEWWTGVFVLTFPPLMKTGGRRWRWVLGLALRTVASSSHSKSYHHSQGVYYFLAPHLLLSVAQFKAVEGNGNYATYILIFSGQIFFATVFWLLCVKLLWRHFQLLARLDYVLSYVLSKKQGIQKYKPRLNLFSLKAVRMLCGGCVGNPVLFTAPCAKGSFELGVLPFPLPDCTERSGLMSRTYFVSGLCWFRLNYIPSVL